jgi:hypothetical protein
VRDGSAATGESPTGLTPLGETIAGRPSLKELQAQYEEFIQDVCDLPRNAAIPRSSERVWQPERTANWVRARLQTRLTVMGLGKGAGQIAEFFYGPDSVRQLCLLTQPEESLSSIQTLEARTLREELFRLVEFTLHAATDDRYSRRAHELVPYPEQPPQVRGRVEFGWGEPHDERPRPAARVGDRRRGRVVGEDDEGIEDDGPG